MARASSVRTRPPSGSGQNSPPPREVRILTFWHSFNYGEHLQNYALSTALQQLGARPRTLQWHMNCFYTLGHVTHPLMAFRARHIPSTPQLFTQRQLQAACPEGGVVLIGGDQVFRNWKKGGEEYQPLLRYFGDFVQGRCTLASYSASFGNAVFDGEPQLIAAIRRLLPRFDRVSVRERSGVELLRTTFGADGVQICDPVFLLEPRAWQQLSRGGGAASWT